MPFRAVKGCFAKDGPLVVKTGKHTGRSAQDQFVVRDGTSEDTVGGASRTSRWRPMRSAGSRPISSTRLKGKDTLFVADLYGGSQPEHRVKVRVINEYRLAQPVHPHHAGAARRPTSSPASCPNIRSSTCRASAPIPARHGCRSETVIAVNLDEKLILIGGTAYAGEMKKSVFGLLNYLLPPKGIMPMHCSANIGPKGDTAIFFGLSGTGKTTLSADPNRTLIGDDEHGWSDTAGLQLRRRLLRQDDPPVGRGRAGDLRDHQALRHGARECGDGPGDARARPRRRSLAENSRGAYPIDFIPNSSEENMGPVPKNIVMLTADAFGVLPPIAKLTPDQAMYHFLSGYTAKVAGTEIGVTEPEATFSTCFGAPFMPRHPSVYGNLLKKRIAKGGVDCWLVNTGWTGGKYGTGKRMPIKATRALLNAALDGSLKNVEFRKDPNFGFDVPVAVPGVDSSILDPRSTWADKADYDRTAAKLVDLFIENFAEFAAHVDEGSDNRDPRSAAA